MSHRPGFLVYFLFELEIELSRLIEINKSLQNENERLERDLGIEKEQIKVFQQSLWSFNYSMLLLSLCRFENEKKIL